MQHNDFIDRSSVLNKITAKMKQINKELCGIELLREAYSTAMLELISAPNVEAEIVLHCKDCRFFFDEFGGYCNCWGIAHKAKQTGYCSDGKERKK